MPRHTRYLALFLILVATISFSKKIELVMTWPKDNPTLKLTFGTFQNMGSYGGQMTLISDVVVQNLTNKIMAHASFNISLLDKSNVRIGNGFLIVDELNPGQSAKIQFQCNAVGQPTMLSIAARNLSGVPASTKLTAISVISIPPGAALKVDDQPAGTTPVTIRLVSGTHTLELHKEGFAVAKTPLDVNPDEAPGGSITVTLGGLGDDTIELRDGSILTADVISMTLESVVISVQGKERTLDRNQVKKMILVERVTQQPVVVQSATPESKPKQ